MKVLKNHFNNNTTILHKDVVVNGCQTFTFAKLDEVCKKFGVPDSVKQQVITAHSDTETWEDNLDEFVMDTNTDVRCTVAKFGNDGHRTALLNDTDTDVRFAVAKFGNDGHRTALLTVSKP